jgi:hypothetical protein
MAIQLYGRPFFCFFLLFCCGCTRQRYLVKNIVPVTDLVLQDDLLYDVSIPFGAHIECEYTARNKKETSVFQLHIPPKEIVYLEEYFINTMEQKGWLLERSFSTYHFLIIEFHSITRYCLIIIHRQKAKNPLSALITLCIASRVAEE